VTDPVMFALVQVGSTVADVIVPVLAKAAAALNNIVDAVKAPIAKATFGALNSFMATLLG
jgi:hypothetical protein